MKKFIALIAVLFIIKAAFASETFVLQGKIGDTPVFMYFLDDAPAKQHNEIWAARYFYQSSLNDIILQGVKDNNTYVFYCHLGIVDGKDNYNDYDEKFELIRSQDNTFSGKWSNRQGKSFNIELKPADIAAYENQNIKYDYVKQLKKEDTYNYIRTSFINLHPDEQQIITYKGKEFISFNIFNVPFDLLGKDFDKKSREIINFKIEEIALNNIIGQLTCATRWEYSNNKGIRYDTKIRYLDHNLISFSIASFWFCGGAHPDEQIIGHLFDLNNGKQYCIDDILNFKQSAIMQQSTGLNEENYKEKCFAPGLFRILNRIYKFQTAEYNNTGYCDYKDIRVWESPSWIYTEEGIEFTPSFARYARKCEKSFVVPFSELTKYKNNQFQYKIEASEHW